MIISEPSSSMIQRPTVANSSCTVFSITEESMTVNNLISFWQSHCMLTPQNSPCNVNLHSFPIYVNHIQLLASSTHKFLLENTLNKYGNKSVPSQHKTTPTCLTAHSSIISECHLCDTHKQVYYLCQGVSSTEF